MSNYRQQGVRNQRGNYRNNCSENMNYRSQRSSHEMECECNRCVCDNLMDEECPERGKDPLRGMPIAMAYVPWQRFCDVFDECEALYQGTIFAELDLDFYGKRCE